MKVLVGANTSAEKWFPNGELGELLRETTLDVLQVKAVLGLTDEQWLQLRNSSVQKYLMEVLSRKRVAIASVPSSDTCEIMQDWDFSMPALANSENFNELYLGHTRVQLPKESNSEVFQRVFGHLLPIARGFEYVDAHIYEKLAEDHSGAHFFIRSLIESGVPRIVLYTQRGNKRTQQFRDSVDKKLEQYNQLLKNEQTFRVEVFNEGKQFPHDRIGSIEFRNRNIHFYLGYGEQMFSSSGVLSFNTLGTVDVDFDLVKRHFRGLGKIDTLPSRR